MPYDPEGTLERVQNGTIRAGISLNPPWTDFTSGEAVGLEPQLLNKFAEQLNARIEWTVDSESDLFRALKHRQLDVVIGGLTSSTPWSKQAALSRPYLTIGNDEHVIAVPQGENRWLLEFDRFLQSQRREAERYYEGEQP
ncbi:transporter substrate-binding domain-containing protein [Gimesia sp.]|uniref:substrate-binding periplasmic protein n=1 Tax=Gimesia sp. TaxID=2024833 RepID=UPI0025C6C8ED|nr:transporter substrate-binding domain-containing protein [Gimesia sp.]|tara:strand:+ start:5770 stop:6189 length:420 start_codon:yes stop_codon:yes gene_type:complete